MNWTIKGACGLFVVGLVVATAACSSSSSSSSSSSGNTSSGNSSSGSTSSSSSSGSTTSSSGSTSSYCCGLNSNYWDCSSSAALEACVTKNDQSGCTPRSTPCPN